MPNLDGGHYFLTMLAPVRTEAVPIGEDRYRSHVVLLREALTRLPTARQNEVTRHSRLNSPFARNRLNHLARFVVIDDVVYNGRVSGNAVADRLRRVDPTVPQHIDRLGCAYLLFSADLDAPGDGETALRAYTDALWSSMRDELVEIFQHCHGFDAVRDASGFHRYVKRCQVETTMPFNDYWIDPLPAKSLPFKRILGVLAVFGGLTLVALVLHLLRIGSWPWGWIALLALAATVLLSVIGYRWLVAKGQEPYPAAPDSDLPSILKALYLQQRFTRFAIETQGVDAETLHRRFAAFITEHRPTAIEDPTQPPGVISS
jgi:hypothetical protein